MGKLAELLDSAGIASAGGFFGRRERADVNMLSCLIPDRGPDRVTIRTNDFALRDLGSQFRRLPCPGRQTGDIGHLDRPRQMIKLQSGWMGAISTVGAAAFHFDRVDHFSLLCVSLRRATEAANSIAVPACAIRPATDTSPGLIPIVSALADAAKVIVCAVRGWYDHCVRLLTEMNRAGAVAQCPASLRPNYTAYAVEGK